MDLFRWVGRWVGRRVGRWSCQNTVFSNINNIDILKKSVFSSVSENVKHMINTRAVSTVNLS